MVYKFYVDSWAIIPQWKVFCTVNLTLSNSSRRPETSTRTSSHVCLYIFPENLSLLFPHYFLVYKFNFIWIAFTTAAKSAEKLTPELVISPPQHCFTLNLDLNIQILFLFYTFCSLLDFCWHHLSNACICYRLGHPAKLLVCFLAHKKNVLLVVKPPIHWRRYNPLISFFGSVTIPWS